ncbi:MAG: apolipoprotein N-acyltransferase [Bacteroidetes bacterium]|nr:apolipoprotein N-acyltransferase [Bacteroidota bacterium]
MINKIKESPLGLSLLTGLLLFSAWVPSSLFFVLFISWIPLLKLMEIGINTDKKTFWFWKWSYLSMFTWNLGTTWWVWFASEGGAIAMLLANSFLMSLILAAVYYTRKKLPNSGYTSFLAYWIAFELFHYNWDLDFPWLTLGNGFAKFPIFVQWYEYTGVLGGSFWILIVNIAIFKVLNNPNKYGKFKPLFLLFFPALLSVWMYFSYSSPKNSKNIEVLIVQPNIDPYSEKFERDPFDITSEMLNQIKESITPQTRFVVLPETAIPEYFEVSEWEHEAKIRLLYDLTKRYPNLAIITGLETFKQYNTSDAGCKKPTLTARRGEDSCSYYDVYNTSALIYRNQAPVYYHKSKLVLGVEKMPYPKYLGFLEKLSINMGGTSGSLGRSENPVIFYGPDNIATCGLICYESIYGNYIREFAQKGTNFLTVITNDGWWHNTPGYKQHLFYGALRAIETRKYIARSANTGISAIIDDRGIVRNRSSWWKKEVIKGEIQTNTKKTFYTQNGDLIGIACQFVAIFMFLGAMVKRKAA